MMRSGWQLKRISGPDVEPVSLDQAKRQCRVDEDITVDDDDIMDWIQAARELAEDYCKRTFCPSTWQLSGPDFPRDYYRGGKIYLPFGPLIALESISYLDVDGTEHFLDPSDPSQVQISGDGPDGDLPPWIWAAVWPGTLCAMGAVKVTYQAGYPGIGSPADASGVPAKVRAAIRTLVAHWYSTREAVVAETRVTPVEVPFTFERALDSLIIYP